VAVGLWDVETACAFSQLELSDLESRADIIFFSHFSVACIRILQKATRGNKPVDRHYSGFFDVIESGEIVGPRNL
jgi:hypothetical protein